MNDNYPAPPGKDQHIAPKPSSPVNAPTPTPRKEESTPYVHETTNLTSKVVAKEDIFGVIAIDSLTEQYNPNRVPPRLDWAIRHG